MTLRLRRRILFLSCCLCLWATLCLVRLVQYTVLRAPALRRTSRAIAWREGVIPTPRGTIFDRDGVPLAWSELRYDLLFQYAPKRPETLSELENELRTTGLTYAPLPLPDTYPATAVRDLPHGSLRIALALAERFPFLKLRARAVRMRVGYMEIQTLLGECETDEQGILRGRSGLERLHNDALSGKNEHFRVMYDRYGNWVPGTLEILERHEESADVSLEERLSELLAKGDESDGRP